MNSTLGFIKLLRPVNLLIIVFTMYAMRWGVLHAIAEHHGLVQGFLLEEWKFGLMVFVMVLLAAAGNMINDYFDLKVDRVNKPEKVIVGRVVKRRVVMAGHHAFNVIATLITVWLAWDQNDWRLILFPVTMSALLWFYSLLFKKQIWIGNFVVSLLVAVVPVWAGFIEVPKLAHAFTLTGGNGNAFSFDSWQWLLGYAGFAFWTTMIREAQKDIEDTEGDKAGGFTTIPIAWGEKGAKRYIIGLFTVLFVAIAITLWAIRDYVPNETSFFIFAAMVVAAIFIPALVSLRFTWIARKKAHYGVASKWSKILMAGGLIIGALMPLWL
ncbi:MAG: geranylgeranylglycerol-phosphate geranylgeranyltransferase [Flavobacteriales bacterium]|nr:geranylgeranylglycerol-phosphate geranylgeranyltransferase [Flavobacteriales bacterium]